MNLPPGFSLPRYLAAKATVDDRALNQNVFQTLKQWAGPLQDSAGLNVLELGCGLGTMAARLTDWGLFRRVRYLGVDLSAACLAHARERLSAWAAARGFSVSRRESGCLTVTGTQHDLALAFQAGEALAFLSRPERRGAFDLIVAQAFLDLVDLEAILPRIFACLKAGGAFYFTLNFDGGTTFWPPVDPSLDARIEQLYHQTMDDRRVAGQATGGSRTGRKLFSLIPAYGGRLTAAGSSDWVVFAGQGGYPHDEAFFLTCILALVAEALTGLLEKPALARWLAARRMQVAQGELVYLARQLDFCGVKPKDAPGVAHG